MAQSSVTSVGSGPVSALDATTGVLDPIAAGTGSVRATSSYGATATSGAHDGPMFEVRRPDDDELCGFVDQDERDGTWRSLAVFGGELGRHGSRLEAEADVLDRGLSSLTLRWQLVDRSGSSEEVVCIQEVRPGRVTVALAPYSMPGVPTRTLTSDELAAGDVELLLP